VGHLALKITEILTCVTLSLNHTQQKELASFCNTIQRNKIVCGVIKRIFECTDTSRCTQCIGLAMQQQQLRFSQMRTKRNGDTLHND